MILGRNKMFGKSKMTLWLMRLNRLNKLDRRFIVVFLLATCLSCVIAWLTPPFSIPDEGAHYLRSFEVSRGHLVNVTGDAGIPIPCRDYLAVAKQDGHVRVAFYQDIAEKMLPNAAECVVSSRNTAGSYSPAPYIVAAFGIRFAEALGYGVETRLKIGRIANAIITSFICLLAILAVQKYRLLLATFVLLPMSMWLRASLSADAMTISISIGYLAYVLHLVEQEVPITRQIIAFLSLLAILLGSVKPVYGLLSFSALILLKRTCEWRINLSNMVALAVPGIAALSIGAMWTLAADPALIYINNYGGANPAQQLEFLWNDPINFAHVVANTFRNNFTFFVAQALVPMLPMQWIPQHDQHAISAVLSIVVLFTMATMPISLSRWQRIVLLGIASICLVATLVPLYLTYTRVGYNEILGLQGRYFLPLAFYAGVAGCINKPWRIFADEATRFTIAIVIPMIISTTLVIKYLG